MAGRMKNSLMTDGLIFCAGAMTSLFLIWTFSSSMTDNHLGYNHFSSVPFTVSCSPPSESKNVSNPSVATFYDDRDLSYSIGKPIKNWDKKRRTWMEQNPSIKPTTLLITGSQSGPCEHPEGDHFLLRLFKNKVDYCRIHGCDLFYNNAFFHPKMTSFWAKLPVVRSAMVAHPEAEWIWWVDSDALFTDMEFKLPLEKYEDYNLIVHGWPDMVYEKKSWVSLNAGIFLIRNCQWSIDFIEVWASMGPQTPNYERWGETLRSVLPDKMFPDSDDQSALVYLLLRQKSKWANKILLENEYDFERYWIEIINTFGKLTRDHTEIEKSVPELRQRHAEKAYEYFGKLREKKVMVMKKGKSKRPFITHFTGCEPCSGHYNEELYTEEQCYGALRRALNFADNQVLRNFGHRRQNLRDSAELEPIPFDYPL